METNTKLDTKLDTKIQIRDDYEETIHRTGRISGILALLIIFSIPTIICVYYNIFPPLSNLLKGVLSVCLIYIPICIAEVFTYTPMLGSGASYLVFVTGNLTNLKIPCASMCMEITGVKPSTREAEVISTISVAVSTMVTEVVIIIGVLALVPLKPILSSATLKPAFDNILPALFGGLGAYFILKQWKLAIAPLLLVIVLSIIVELNVSLLILIAAPFSILSSWIMYKKGLIKKA